MRRTAVALILSLVALAGTACDSTILLGPDAPQGIEGLVLLGPQCPVESPDSPCPDLPYQASIQIMDRDQFEVTRVQSGADGKFRVGLEPGIYLIVPEQGQPLPTAEEKVVSVQEGIWATVTINYDTGIR